MSNGAYAGLRHCFVFTTKPQFDVKRACSTKARLGGQNKGIIFTKRTSQTKYHSGIVSILNKLKCYRAGLFRDANRKGIEKMQHFHYHTNKIL